MSVLFYCAAKALRKPLSRVRKKPIDTNAEGSSLADARLLRVVCGARHPSVFLLFPRCSKRVFLPNQNTEPVNLPRTPGWFVQSQLLSEKTFFDCPGRFYRSIEVQRASSFLGWPLHPCRANRAGLAGRRVSETAALPRSPALLGSRGREKRPREGSRAELLR